MLNIKPQDVALLIETFERSGSQEMRVAAGGFELQLSKSANGLRQVLGARLSDTKLGQVVAPAALPPATASLQEVQSISAAQPAADTGPANAMAPAGHQFVRAANLGTYYGAPKPGAENYVDVGTKVTPETEVCLIEVMKLFTPLVAGITGTIREVLVKDGAVVEFDQPMFLVQLDS